jgi:hypothetical protein
MRVGGQRFANALKGIGLALAAAVPLAGLARAADAPAPPSPAPDCFRSLYDYLNASASECPLTYAGLTLYGTVDVGYGFETNGAPFNRAFGPGAAYLISKATSGPLASIPERAEFVGGRAQDERADRRGLVAGRRLRIRI